MHDYKGRRGSCRYPQDTQAGVRGGSGEAGSRRAFQGDSLCKSPEVEVECDCGRNCLSTIMGGMPLAGSQERPDKLEMPTLGSGFYPAVLAPPRTEEAASEQTTKTCACWKPEWRLYDQPEVDLPQASSGMPGPHSRWKVTCPRSQLCLRLDEELGPLGVLCQRSGRG